MGGFQSGNWGFDQSLPITTIYYQPQVWKEIISENDTCFPIITDTAVCKRSLIVFNKYNSGLVLTIVCFQQLYLGKTVIISSNLGAGSVLFVLVRGGKSVFFGPISFITFSMPQSYFSSTSFSILCIILRVVKRE